MNNYNFEELSNKSTEELKLIRSQIYDNFIKSLSNVPTEVRETFNNYINLARIIDIILNERNKVENQENKLKI